MISVPSFLNPATANPEKTIKTASSSTIATPIQNAVLDFELENRTGYALSGLYLSPSKADDWGDNILEVVLDDEESVEISFSPDSKAVKWDLRADWLMSEDEDEQEYVYWRGLSLDQITKLTLYYDEKTNKTSAKIE